MGRRARLNRREGIVCAGGSVRIQGQMSAAVDPVLQARGVEAGLRWRAAVRALRWGGCVLLAAAVALFVGTSWHWRVVNDAALMHYVVMLGQRGMAPYVGVHDINFPGAYLADWVALSLAPGADADHLWRLYDLGLLVAAAAAMIVIAWPVDWFAGVFAGGIFALFHGRDGIGQAGQRDLALAVLCLVAGAAALSAWRRRDSAANGAWLWGLAGLALGAATTIKPLGALYLVALLAWVGFGLRDRSRTFATAAACGGFLLPLLAAAGLLVRWHAWGAFRQTCALLLPYHAALGRAHLSTLLSFVWPASFGKLGALAAGGGMLLLRSSRRRLFLVWLLSLSAEVWVAIGGAALGLICFLAQGKGYPYQRYPFSAFLLLWIGVLLARGLRARSRVGRGLAMAGVLFGVCVCAPSYLAAARRAGWQEPCLEAMQGDLEALGPLDGQVQCVDSITGCVNVLYRMGVRQATGTLYDEFLFPQLNTGGAKPAAVALAQAQFLNAIGSTPPRVLVVTAEGFPSGPDGYGKLALWPEFATLLTRRYRLIDQRDFPPAENGQIGFRVYLRR